MKNISRVENLIGVPYNEALAIIKNNIEYFCIINDFDITITGIDFTGSQVFGKPNKKSDLDVILTYKSNSNRVREDDLFNALNGEEFDQPFDIKLDINPIENGNIKEYQKFAANYKKDLRENIQPFKLEQEKERIRDVLNIVDKIEYGFISKINGEKITDRDFIHNCDLDKYYKVNDDPIVTIKNKLGICQDQSIAIKYLMNLYHPEDDVYLYGITKSPKGHCVPCYNHDDKWYYLENSWDKEKGLHGPFDSKNELEKYLEFIYFKNHKDDTPASSKVEVFDYDEYRRLNEDTRNQLISKSRTVDSYKNQQFGKNRFERKRLSKIANQVKSYNSIDMNKLFKQDLLEVKIPVIGETNQYDVTMQFRGIIAELSKNIKNNQNKFEFKTVLQALTKIFNTADIRVNCVCDDFKYRYAHNLIINNNSTEGTDKDPGPGTTGITAQMNGKGCKHILLVLSNQDWLMKIASVIKNYILYMDEHRHDLFLKAIFPKLYNTSYDEAADANLVSEDTNLDSEKSAIEAINTWAANRGKIKPGTNINPAKGKGSIIIDKEENNK